MTEKGSSVSLFLLHQNSKEKHQSGMRTLSKRVWPTYDAGCIILRTLTVMLKCGSFQAQESALAVTEVLHIALHVYHGWTVRQPCYNFLPIEFPSTLQVLLGRASSLDKISVHRMFEARYHVPDMSLFKNKRSLVMWQKWSGSVEREKNPNSCTMERCVPGSVTVGVKTVIWLTCVLTPDCQETEKRTCLLIFPAASSSHLPLFLAFL